jgi:hypothetical protein
VRLGRMAPPLAQYVVAATRGVSPKEHSTKAQR